MSMTAKTQLFLLDSRTRRELVCISLPPTELRPNRGTIILLDHYCGTSSCDIAHLAAYRVDGEVVEVELLPDDKVRIMARRPEGHEPDFDYNLVVRLSDGVVSFHKDEALAEGSRELLDQVQAGLAPEHLDMLRRRKRESDDDRDWKERDWSWVQRGMCIGWAELFPKSKAWVFEYEGASILVDDQYCATASCDCSDVILTFLRVDRRGPNDSEAAPLGAVRYDLRTRRREVESAAPGSSPKAVLRLLETAIRALPAIPDELDHRQHDMRGFADWLAARRLAERPKPAAAAPGRNAPCPCGSGRKYKKCCLP